ncbi:allene oxide cyclase, chloroplastic-like protein [Tanacetum coccineum]
MAAATSSSLQSIASSFKLTKATNGLSVNIRSFSVKSQSTNSSESSRPTKDQCSYVFMRSMKEIDGRPASSLRLGSETCEFTGDTCTPLPNQIYSADLETRLGITAGICILIRNLPEVKGDRYEAIYSFHLGDYGQIAVQGAYITTEDTYLTVTGGTGIFAGAYGQVKLQQLVFPFKLFYTFYLQGLANDLPAELLVTPVTPSPAVEASAAAKAVQPGATGPNYSD